MNRQIPDLVLTDKKKRTCQLVDFVSLVDHRIKMKERQISKSCLRAEKTVEGDINSSW